MSRTRLLALCLALITLVIFLPATRHDFLDFDDDDYVTANPMVEPGLTPAGIEWAFTTFHSANWHPLTWLSHMADCQLFNLNAGAHHFVNVLFHATNAALVFLLLWRLTGLIPPAALVAALFAWHPLHVESVAWVAERKDVLSTFFALLALLSYAKYARENCRRSRWFALFFFALGLLAKPMIVTLPFLLLLLDYWPLRRFSLPAFRRLLWEKIPFFALSAASCVVTFLAQRSGHTVVSLEQMRWEYRLENAMLSVARYLLKLAWPVDLAVIYPFRPISTTTWLLAGGALISISLAVWLARNRNRCWLVGWLWFLGTLVPVIGLVQVGAASMADRYSYLPSIGVFMAVAFGLYEWSWSKKLFPFIAALPLIACVLATERQLGWWRNSETLFRHTIAVTDNNEAAHLNLAIALDWQGRATEALAEYREVLRLNPAHYQTHFAIGNLLLKRGHPEEALAEYRLCLSQDPQVPALHDAAACALAMQGNLTAALPEFAEAEHLDPHYAQPHLELAKIRFQNGQDSQGVDELQAAARAEPYNFQTLTTVARYLAANTNDAARDAQSALALALKANELSRNREPEVFDVLGMAFAANGDFSNAVTCAQNALKFLPDDRRNDSGPVQNRLQLYQNRQPWRESFRGTNAPAR